MKSPIPVLVAAAVTSFAPHLQAYETAADIETDHLDAADEGDARTVGVLLDPLGVALGHVGAEVDVMLCRNVGLSFEGDWMSSFASAYGASAGVPLFPSRSAFRELYVHPRLSWARVSASGGWLSLVAAGTTVGYEWIWPVGATLRVGGGAAYAMGLAASAGAARGLTGLRPQVDASVGWVF